MIGSRIKVGRRNMVEGLLRFGVRRKEKGIVA
jgi:hypothetical protein